jgi:hypothetical protein
VSVGAVEIVIAAKGLVSALTSLSCGDCCIITPPGQPWRMRNVGLV